MHNIHISNNEAFERRLAAIKEGGASSLHIVSDFDRTLTKAFIGGTKVSTSYSHLREGNYLSPEYHDADKALFAKYHPMEIDPNLSIEKKYAAMDSWWNEHWALFISAGMKKIIIEDIVKTKSVGFREGADSFFSLIAEKGIPLLVFSAGIGNVIEGALKSKGWLTEKVHIISNFFIWGDDGKATGHTSPLIHTFNKNEVAVKDHAYSKEVEKRKNVILLGDSIGDIGMTGGIEHDNIIRIGFLNKDVDVNLPQYRSAYDIVITGDGSMEYVTDLLKSLL